MPRVPLSVITSPAFSGLPPARLIFSLLVPRKVTARVPQHGPRVHPALLVLIVGGGELAVFVWRRIEPAPAGSVEPDGVAGGKLRALLRAVPSIIVQDCADAALLGEQRVVAVVKQVQVERLVGLVLAVPLHFDRDRLR